MVLEFIKNLFRSLLVRNSVFVSVLNVLLNLLNRFRLFCFLRRIVFDLLKTWIHLADFLTGLFSYS